MCNSNLNCESCEKLGSIQNELDSYQKCAETNLQQISALNIKYEQKVNELSTIINILEHINLVTDHKNLFSIINDMLIGVLGVTSSTIFIYDGKQYVVETSNIPRQALVNMDNTIAPVLKLINRLREPLVLEEDQIIDSFSRFRNIKSAVAVPLVGKESAMGILYLEHTKANYFTAESIRYLNTLATAIRLTLENARLYARLEEMTLVDSLTGLYNRMFFSKQIQNCVEDYEKFGLPFILVFADVDHLRDFNDAHGHFCGDMMLKETASMIRSAVRKDDIVCRYGGEEFAIIFRNTRNIESITTRLENLRKKIAGFSTEYSGKPVSITCTFGGAGCSPSKPAAEEVIKLADMALKEAKNEGVCGLRIYS